ncbi:hypothetical protein [Amycolatopsis sp. WGS_07]|uniref:hypothetical protein n=1 Tax=Amycolatopsis sp. WGS_07 TaxID=3076764 RepID=UPI003873B65B
MCCILAAELPYLVSCAGDEASARRIANAVDRGLRERNRADILAWDAHVPSDERTVRWQAAAALARKFRPGLDGLDQLTARRRDAILSLRQTRRRQVAAPEHTAACPATDPSRPQADPPGTAR